MSLFRVVHAFFMNHYVNIEYRGVNLQGKSVGWPVFRGLIAENALMFVGIAREIIRVFPL